MCNVSMKEHQCTNDLGEKLGIKGNGCCAQKRILHKEVLSTPSEWNV